MFRSCCFRTVPSLLFLWLLLSLVMGTLRLSGQTTGELLRLLTDKGVLTPSEFDSLKARAVLASLDAPKPNQFVLRMECRPRAELRYGYQQLPADTSVAAFFTGQRTRLALDYTFSHKLRAAFSMQDLRIWGSSNPRGTGGTVQVFEAWAESIIAPRWSVRVGRQRLVYDNQRLFSDNNWRIGGASHDAVVLKYESSHFSAHLVGAFNQTADRLFGTDFSPSGFSNYKSLLVNYLQFRPTGKLTFTVIHVADGWQDLVNPEKIHQRLTSGGRVEYKAGRLGGNVGAWFQYGRNPKGEKLSAWYLNPELGYSSTWFHFKAGAELFSGNLPDETTTDHSFVPLYGSGHSFNGAMDMITRFPGDVGGSGLINPYLVFSLSISESFSCRATFHGFWLQNDWKEGEVFYPPWLGVESDVMVSYKPNSFTCLELGSCLASFTETFVRIKAAQAGSEHTIPYFSYLCLILKPVLLEIKW